MSLKDIGAISYFFLKQHESKFAADKEFAATFAQSKTKPAMMNDCCMMKDGKMMIMKDGKKMMMKEGDCMEMSGKMGKCSMMNNSMKNATMKKNKNTAMVYTCPMHHEVTSDKTGKCPKCGMDLVKKN